MKIILLLLSVLLSLNSIQAQNDWALILIGKVKAEETSLPFENALVKVTTNYSDTSEYIADKNGGFEIKLASDNVYLVTFSYPEYVSKSLEFSTENVSQEYKHGGDDQFQFQISLFRQLEGLDVSIFENPLARVELSDEGTQFMYNNEYSNSIKSEVQKVMKEREKLLKSNVDD